MRKFLFRILGFLMVLGGILLFLIVQPVFFADRPLRNAPPVSADILEAHVRTLTGPLHPRSFDQGERLEAVVRYLEEYLQTAGGRVRLMRFTVEGREYVNVLAEFGPDTGPLLVVGAHYDSFAELEHGEAMYTPGADDNASGVAALLALGALLGEHPPAQRVLLAAYCLEEPPFFQTESMGSAVHATDLARDGQKVMGMISLEMVGYFSDEPGSQKYPAQVMGLVYPDRGNFISVIGRIQDMGMTRKVKAAMQGATDLPVWSMNAHPVVPGIDFSDHRNFWAMGFPALMITDTAFYRNTNYHTPEDTAETLDYPRMSKVVRGVFVAVMSLTDTRW